MQLSHHYCFSRSVRAAPGLNPDRHDATKASLATTVSGTGSSAYSDTEDRSDETRHDAPVTIAKKEPEQLEAASSDATTVAQSEGDFRLRG